AGVGHPCQSTSFRDCETRYRHLTDSRDDDAVEEFGATSLPILTWEYSSPLAREVMLPRQQPPGKPVGGTGKRNKESTMTQLEKVLYTAKAHTTGGRDGASRTSDGRLDIKLS